MSNAFFKAILVFFKALTLISLKANDKSPKKLIDYKNAAAMAISIITDEFQQEYDGNIFAECYNKYHCANCYNGIKNFAHFACQTNFFRDMQNFIKFS
jgi:hypothetical protein